MPRTRMTDRWLKSHRAAGREEWTDSVATGLLVRFGPDAPVFYARFRERGRYRRVRLGSFPEVKLLEARAKVAALASAREHAEEEAPRPEPGSFADLVAAFLRHRKAKRESGLAEVERMLRRDVLPRIGDRLAASIRPRDVAAILDAAIDRGAPTQANRLRSHLIRIFRFGMERERCETNPALVLSKPHRERSRDRVLSDAEIVALWRELEVRHPATRHLFRFLLLTGLRPGEARLLTWQDVDGWQLRIPAERMKARREHRLPLSSLAHAVLEAHRLVDLPGAVIFQSPLRPGEPYGPSSLSHTARKIGAKLGFGFRPHDLRRTCATGLAALDVSEEVRQRVLAHAPLTVTGRVYNAHRYEEETRVAMERWGEHVQALLTSRQLRSPATQA